MTNVEKFFKEWGSVCRMLTKKDKAIYSHKELLDFAEQYRQSQVNNVIFNDMDKEKLIKLTKGKVSGFVEKAQKRRELKNNVVSDDVSKCCKCGKNEAKGKTNQCDSCLLDGII